MGDTVLASGLNFLCFYVEHQSGSLKPKARPPRENRSKLQDHAPRREKRDVCASADRIAKTLDPSGWRRRREISKYQQVCPEFMVGFQ